MSDLARHERLEARDPTTSPERLGVLLERHLACVLENPALPQAASAVPPLWVHVTAEGWVQLTAEPACPPGFVTWLLGLGEVPGVLLLRLMHNRGLPRPLRREALLLLCPGELPGRLSAMRPLLAELLEPEELALMELAHLGDLQPGFASDPALDAAALTRLAGLGRVGATLAAAHPACPDALLEQIFAARVPPLSPELLAEAPLSPRCLSLMLRHGRPEQREAAVQNPRLAPEDLQRAASADHLLVRTWAARHPALPAPQKALLVRDPVEGVRMALARHAALSPQSQRVLASDPSSDVRRCLLENPLTGREARRLAHLGNRAAQAYARHG